MASKGSLYLKNSDLTDAYRTISKYESTAQSAFYAQYKNAYKISNSNYFRGDAADAFKSYISTGAINVITEFMDVTSDLTVFIQLLQASFLQYESQSSGRVAESALDYIESNLRTHENTFSGIKGELNTVCSLASEYISVRNLSLSSVETAYDDVNSKVDTVRSDLYAVDDDCTSALEELTGRISSLRAMISGLLSYCYNDDGTINESKIASAGSQDWYYQGCNTTLYIMFEEDPFEYVAGETTIAEDQWVSGLCSDVYTYGGYTFLSASGESGVDDGTAFAKGAAEVAGANVYLQFTEYLKAEGELDVAYADGTAQAGIGTLYASGSAGVATASATATAGSDALNLYAKAKATVLSADGKVGWEVDDDSISFGISGTASAAKAQASIGTSFFSDSETQYDDDYKYNLYEDLTGSKLSVSAGISAGAGVWFEGKEAADLPVGTLCVVSLDIKAEFLLGFDLQMSYFIWRPW